MSFFGIRNVVIGQAVQSVTVTDVSTEIVAENTSRGGILIVNVSTSDAWVGVDVTPTVDKGILLGKNGGNLLLDAGLISTGSIKGICKSGQTALVEFQEFNVS